MQQYYPNGWHIPERELQGSTVPHKAWLVVMRNAIQKYSKGVISKQFDTKQAAVEYLKYMRTCGSPTCNEDYDTWVIAKDDY